MTSIRKMKSQLLVIVFSHLLRLSDFEKRDLKITNSSIHLTPQWNCPQLKKTINLCVEHSFHLVQNQGLVLKNMYRITKLDNVASHLVLMRAISNATDF